MFTGLIEEVGRLLSHTPSAGGGAQLKVAASTILGSLAIGDSIAVNGVCLTAVSFNTAQKWVLFDAVEETLRLTTLQSLDEGSPLNLERSLAVGDRIGGHFVTGHVDGQGKLCAREAAGNGIVHEFSCPPNLINLIAHKGSVAVDGISLTVTEVSDRSFSVWIVPHTLKATNLSSLSIGNCVNLENDILSKYVARALHIPEATPISFERLQKAGFA